MICVSCERQSAGGGGGVEGDVNGDPQNGTYGVPSPSLLSPRSPPLLRSPPFYFSSSLPLLPLAPPLPLFLPRCLPCVLFTLHSLLPALFTLAPSSLFLHSRFFHPLFTPFLSSPSPLYVLLPPPPHPLPTLSLPSLCLS